MCEDWRPIFFDKYSCNGNVVYAGDGDIEIKCIGLRPGEKLYEELFDICEEQIESGIEGIFEARSRPIPLPFITMAINRIAELNEERPLRYRGFTIDPFLFLRGFTTAF